jgi:DNA-binding transcriptional regulator YiaG
MNGTDFRAALREVRLSQRAFAMRSGASVSSVNRWCLGSQPVPGWVEWVLSLLRERQEILTKLNG